MGIQTQKDALKGGMCIVSPLYHPSLGGLGRQAQLLTERIAREGLPVFVIARRMKGMPDADFAPDVKVYRAWSAKPFLHNFEQVSMLNILISLTFAISCAILLIRYRKKYHIVHFHGASLPLFVNLPLLKIMGKRVVAKIAAAGVGTEAGSLRGRHFGLGNSIIRELQMVDSFVATTAEIKEGLLRDGFPEEKIRRITNFIDMSEFRPVPGSEKEKLRNALGLGDHPTVIFSGRFIERKGVTFLLDAWRDIAVTFPNARLILLGSGPLLDEMRRKALQLEIADAVQFRGHVHEIADFLRAADIFVLPSLQEGMPNSLLEAMACGLPPVATRIGGVVDIIRNGENGVLVEAGDGKALTAGLRRLLADKKFTDDIAENALRTIQDMFSLDSIISQYLELYQKMLA